MVKETLIICLLTFTLNIIGVLAYSTRITGLRTKLYGASYSVYNILSLVSRMATVLQAPILAKTIEININSGKTTDTSIFRWAMLAAFLATLFGALAMPSFNNLLAIAVKKYYQLKSMPRFIIHAISSKKTLSSFRKSFIIPSTQNFIHLLNYKVYLTYNFFINIFVSVISTCAVLSSLYAGCLIPQLRATANSLVGIVNGLAMVLSVVFIDPYISLINDEVIHEVRTEQAFKQDISYILFARLIGTLLAQLLFIPIAEAIVFVAYKM
jgi:hypothetical protein